MFRFSIKDVLALALFLLVLFSGAAAGYVRWFRSRGVEGIIRDVVDDTLHPAKGKAEPGRGN